jgi:hypothetical protein
MRYFLRPDGATSDRVGRRALWLSVGSVLGLVLSVQLTALLIPRSQAWLTAKNTVWIVLLTPLVYALSCLYQARRLRRCGYRLCPKCGYNTTGLPPRGPCPECGAGYDAERARLEWESAA